MHEYTFNLKLAHLIVPALKISNFRLRSLLTNTIHTYRWKDLIISTGKSILILSYKQRRTPIVATPLIRCVIALTPLERRAFMSLLDLIIINFSNEYLY